MKYLKKLKIILLLCLTFQQGMSQLDSIIVERYYVSDSFDATDLTGGGIPEGSVTYRIYADLAPGSKLKKLFGNESHRISIKSTEPVFNNKVRGRSLGKDIRVNRLDENTVALDSWLTIGLASESHTGVVKSEDTNGSIIGGSNNNGGSQLIPGGLLINNDSSAGLPLTSADGMMPASGQPSTWSWLARYNGSDLTAFSTDTSIFGSITAGNRFESNEFTLSVNGMTESPPNNRFLLAQITTKGEISFSLNLEIEEINGSASEIVRYVAENPEENERTSTFLTYPFAIPPPPACGCKDPHFVEYNSEYECHSQDSCKTPVVYGCMDTFACNYDRNATFNIASLCCYPGRCNNRDINIVCPGINTDMADVHLFPNPASGYLKIQFDNFRSSDVTAVIYNNMGSPVMMESLSIAGNKSIAELNISSLTRGAYFIFINSEDVIIKKTLIKN